MFRVKFLAVLFAKASVICLLVLVCSCNNSEKNKIEKPESKKINLIEETPNIYTEPDVTENIGKIIFDSYSGLPKSNNKTTPLKALAKLVKAKSKSNTITIKYLMHFSSDYSEDWKVVYNRTEKKVYDITISSNIQDVYENITDDVIIATAKDKECPTIYCLSEYSKSEMQTDFSKRKVDAVGTQPAQSEYDGSVKAVEEYIKAKSKDASSIKFIEWSKVSAFGEYWIVRCKFEGSNSFGSVITENRWFYIQNDKVIKTKDINSQ